MRPFSSPFRDQVGQLLDRIPNIRSAPEAEATA